VTEGTFFAMSEPAQIAALALTFVVHVAGAACLVWALLGDRGLGGLRDWWNDDGGEPPPSDPRTPDPRPSGPGLPLPLGDSMPSDVRLRQPGHIGEGRRPARRPHEPVRTPERV
jgi:hypothetical protein